MQQSPLKHTGVLKVIGNVIKQKLIHINTFAFVEKYILYECSHLIVNVVYATHYLFVCGIKGKVLPTYWKLKNQK